jgi:hypothetical protein
MHNHRKLILAVSLVLLVSSQALAQAKAELRLSFQQLQLKI